MGGSAALWTLQDWGPLIKSAGGVGMVPFLVTWVVVGQAECQAADSFLLSFQGPVGFPGDPGPPGEPGPAVSVHLISDASCHPCFPALCLHPSTLKGTAPLQAVPAPVPSIWGWERI